MGSSSICDLTLAGFSYELDHNNNNSNNNDKKDQPTKEKKNTLSLKYDNLFRHISFGSLLSKSYDNTFEVEKTVSLEGSDEDENVRPRKKLRLTKEQSAVLEDRFKHHSTLNPVEKQALSRQLNLRQRQVEVWFQNRRARTKLKQIELNVESLKRCRDSLTEDNERLHKEIEQLKAFKSSSAHATTLVMQMPPATVTICPSCGRISTNVDGGGYGGADTRSKPSVVIKPKARSCSHFAHT